MLNILGLNIDVHFKCNSFIFEIPNVIILRIYKYGVHNYSYSMFLYDKKLIYTGDHIRSKHEVINRVQFYLTKYLNNVVH